MDAITLLKNSIYDAYDLERWAQPGLRSNNPSASFVMMSTNPIPDLAQYLDITKIGDEISWRIDLPDEIASHSLQGSSRGSVPAVKSHTLRHNFVSEAIFFGATDKKLGEAFPPLNDDDDVLSPDFIYQDDRGIYHVFEVGTSRTPSEEKLKQEFSIKHFKYSLALLNRSVGEIVTYTPIIVGTSGVCSNIRIPQAIVDDLLLRFAIGVALENIALGKGFKITKSESETMVDQYMAEIKKVVSDLPNKEIRSFADQVLITNDHIENVLSPTDEKRVLRDYAESRIRAKKEMLKIPDYKKIIDKYQNSFPKRLEARHDMKPVSLFPLINCAKTESCLKPNRYSITCKGDHEGLKRVWNQALKGTQDRNWKEEDVKELVSEVMEKDPKKLKAKQEARRKQRKEYHRVELKDVLDNKVLRELRLDGLFAKSVTQRVSNTKDEAVLRKRREQKKGFSYSTETDDIENYLFKDMGIFEDDGKGEKKETAYLKDLIKLSSKLANNSTVGEEFFEKWSTTKFYNALDLITDIGMELSGCIKKNTNNSQMILHKLRYHDCYLLMKTTNSESHLFFSLMFPNLKKDQVICELPYQKLIWDGAHAFVPFKSVRIDKLENISSMSSALLCCASFWSYFYGLPDANPESFRNHKEASVMLKYTLLLRLEDKAQTEEIVTQTRYMYMQIFKSNYSVVKPQPFSVISKFPVVVRSRLSLWTIHGIIRSFSRMMNNIPYRKSDLSGDLLNEMEDSMPGDEWFGLLNFITGGSIPNATMAVNLFYIGYAKNKNEISQGNSEWKLLEKVLEEEFSLDMDNMEKSYGLNIAEDEVPGTKQFEIEALKYGCDKMIEKLKFKLGLGWQKKIEDDVYKELAKCLSHEIATLKASSKIDHMKKDKIMKDRIDEPLSRLKVIEAIAANIRNFGLNPMTSIQCILARMEMSKSGVICDLFKKNQHGGLREIYVLTIESRILQLFIEVCSRTICSLFEEETLTHPSNKMKLLDQHKQRSAKIGKARSCTFVDFCNSSDKTRWNQNFVMPALSIPLFKILPKEMHNMIQRILNLWSSKLIRIPPEVCNLLKMRIPLSSDVYSKLLHQFSWARTKGGERVVMPEKNYKFVQVTTGMMQGILHYTSSLLHLSFLHASSYLTIRVLKTKYPDYRFYMTQVCSSDDSASIISTFTKKGQNEISVQDISVITDVEVSCHTLNTFCQYFCTRNSSKSTTGMFDYVEFNSEFLFKNTIAQPVIKLVLASLNLSESDCYLNRFQTMYNIISDCYASGFPSYNANLVQISQLLLHYKTMGSTTNVLFSRWFNLITKVPDPIYGFFALDSELITGLMGYNFSRFLIVSHNFMVNQNMMAIDWAESTINPDGSVSESLVIKTGDLTRWKKLMYRISNEVKEVPGIKRPVVDPITGTIRPDQDDFKFPPVEELIQGKFDLLFRHPEDRKELKIKLLIKASSPGVSKSLSRGNPFVQSLALSLYSISTHCFTKTTLTKVSSGVRPRKNKETNKTSLLLELSDRVEKLEKDIQTLLKYNSDELDIYQSKHLNTMKLCYPMHDRYKEVLEILDLFRERHMVKVGRIRQKKNFIVIQPIVYDLPLTLTQTLSHYWFGFSLRVTKRIFTRCLQSYVEAMPWIRQTFTETLIESPFETHTELFNFISAQSFKTRKILKCGPGIYSNVFSGQIKQLIKKCYRAQMFVEPGAEGSILATDLHSAQSFRWRSHPEVELSLALQIPVYQEKEKRVIKILSTIFSEKISPQSVKMMPKRQAIMYYLCQLHNGGMDMEGVLIALKNTGLGTLISFTKDQGKTIDGSGKVKWGGQGECLIFSEGLLLKATLEEGYVRRVYVKDWDALRSNPGILREVFNKLNSKAYPKTAFEVRCKARFDGQRFVPISCGGTPIIIDDDLSSTYLNPSMCKFSIKGGRCGIYCCIQDREVPIIEYKPIARDIDYNINKIETGNIWDCWVSCQPMTAQEATNMLTMMSEEKDKVASYEDKGSHYVEVTRKGKRRDISQIKNVVKWVKDTLEGRLRYRSLLCPWEDFSNSILLSTVVEEENESDDEFDDIMSFMNDNAIEDTTDDTFLEIAKGAVIDNLKSIHKESLFNLAFESCLEFEEDPSLEKTDLVDFMSEDSPYRAIFHNWLDDETPEKQSIYKTEMFNYYFMHPLWDNLIDESLKMDNKFFRKISFGEVPSSDKVLGLMIMKLLDIKEKHQELPLSEKYRGKMTDDWIRSLLSRAIDEDDSFTEEGESPRKVHFDEDSINIPSTSRLSRQKMEEDKAREEDPISGMNTESDSDFDM